MSKIVKQKTTKETEFRTPILEKFHTAKNSTGSKDSSAMLSLGTSAPYVNNQAAISPADSSVADECAMQSVENDHAVETSPMDCDGTFHSAYEEVDTSYYSCGGSFADSSNNESLNESENKGKFQDVDLNELTLTKDSDTQGSALKEFKTEDLSFGERSRCNGHKEGEQDFGVDVDVEECAEDCDQMNKPSAGSLTKESDLHSCSESNTDDLNTYSNYYDDHTRREHNDISDDFQEEEHDKDSDPVNSPLSDEHINEVANHGDSPEESDSFGAKEGEKHSSCDDLKEEDCDVESEQINKPLNDKHFHEDSNDDAYPDGSDSSDDDLLTPPRFLYENTKLKPDIRTPEKGIAPAYATPSPVMREASAKEDKSIKYKLSFDKLIAEKAKHRERDAELAEMEAELQRGIENGGIGLMQVPSTFSDIESEEELTDGMMSD